MEENSRKMEEKRLRTVAVYCGASAGKNPIYTEKAAGNISLELCSSYNTALNVQASANLASMCNHFLLSSPAQSLEFSLLRNRSVLSTVGADLAYWGVWPMPWFPMAAGLLASYQSFSQVCITGVAFIKY